MIHEILNLPAVKALSTGSILDLVGWGFFGLLAFSILGGSYAMIRHQIKAITRAITSRRSATLFVEPYTQAILSDTCPEVQKLRGTYAPAARVELLKSICKELESEVASSLSQSLFKQFRAHLARELKLLRDEERKPRVKCGGGRYYVGNGGEA